LARGLVDALQAQGKPAIRIYGRTYPLLSRLLMALGRAILLRKHDIWQDYRAYARDKGEAMQRSVLAWPYAAAIWLDYTAQTWLKLAPHLLSQRIVVMDRYVYDTVISDLAVHLSYSPVQTMRAIDQGLRWVPEPALTLLVDLSEEIAFSRKEDVPHVDFLRERRTRYVKLLVRPEVERLDGEAAPAVLLEAALQSLDRTLNGDRPL
jgi:dTMP kinase